jgi:hypothetical protein
MGGSTGVATGRLGELVDELTRQRQGNMTMAGHGLGLAGMTAMTTAGVIGLVPFSVPLIAAVGVGLALPVIVAAMRGPSTRTRSKLLRVAVESCCACDAGSSPWGRHVTQDWLDSRLDEGDQALFWVLAADSQLTCAALASTCEQVASNRP